MNALYLGYRATAVLNSLQPRVHEGEKHGAALFSAMRSSGMDHSNGKIKAWGRGVPAGARTYIRPMLEALPFVND